MKRSPELLFLLVILSIVFFVFFHTLSTEWKNFDENIIYAETILPIPLSFSQIFEYLEHFGINNYFEASNPFYSTVFNLRNNPVNNIITLFINYLFQKKSFNYHLFLLILHLINTGFLFLLLNKIKEHFNFASGNVLTLLLISVLTLIWSFHPANVEAILFVTNWPPILSYTICIFILYLLFPSHELNLTLKIKILTLLLFAFSIFTCECVAIFPFIMFVYFYTYYTHFKKDKIKNSISSAIGKSIGLFLVLSSFAIIFLVSMTSTNIVSQFNISPKLTLERIFWFSPQVFFHLIKLIVYPFNLSIDQTSMVKFGKSYFDPYAIFCIFFLFSFVLFLVLSLILIKNKWAYFAFVTFFPFLIALLPFLHIVSPIYCIASERYLYLPVFLLVIGISNLIFYLLSKKKNYKSQVVILLSVILLFFGLKTYARTFEWQNSITLFQSALKENSNELFKGLREEFLGSLFLQKTNQKIKEKGHEYIQKGLNTLTNYLTLLENEKQAAQEKVPNIIKFYGLDLKTMQAKTAYLLAFTRLNLFMDTEGAFEIIHPYMRDLSITDTQIIDMYLGLLFRKNDLDLAEKLINKALQVKITPTVLVIAAELHKTKYKDYKKAELYLKTSFKYFPYDIQTLSSLKNFYNELNKPYEYAYFSYLYGLRTHSEESLKTAYNIFMHLNEENLARKALKNIEIIKNKTV